MESPLKRNSLAEETLKSIVASFAMEKRLSRGGGGCFSDATDVKNISLLHQSAIDKLFYNGEDFAEMRCEAFMKECGC
jgi:hypothetical protein